MPGDATLILESIVEAEANGDVDRAARVAAEQLLPIVYDDLRAIAQQRLDGERSPTIDATELVHEAWVRLVGPDGHDRAPGGDWDGRRHFIGAAAIAMGRILVDRARARLADKRGGDRHRVELDTRAEVADLGRTFDDADLLDLDEALVALEAERPAHAELVRLRVFLGLSIADAAAALGVSDSTVERRWIFARAWLTARLDG